MVIITLNDAKKAAKKTLSEKRYIHTCNVKNLAVKLAKIYGENEDDVALAAFLHDIAKEKPKDKLLQILKKNDIIASGVLKRPFPVWHAVAGAIIAKQEYKIDNIHILNAISCHTTGKENMSTIDKIIYVSDMASEDRTYPEAEMIRKMAMVDISKACVKALGLSIEWLKAEGKTVDEATLVAYAEQKRIYYGGN